MSQVQSTSNQIATAEGARHALLTMWTIRRADPVRQAEVRHIR